MDAWTIEYYETADGYSPVLEYLPKMLDKLAMKLTSWRLLEPRLGCHMVVRFRGQGSGNCEAAGETITVCSM